MGNSGSRQGDDQRKHNQEIGIQQASSKFNQHKVLLDLNAPPKLRATENGIILHRGGTISQRRQEKISYQHQHHRRNEENSGEFKRSFYGSEPDLRFGVKEENNYSHDNASKLRISRNRKKYKAPQAPQHEHPVPDYFEDWEVVQSGKPSRRLRLFITKAESKKKTTHEQSSYNVVNSSMLPPSGRLRRSHSTPQFQQEQESLRIYEEEDDDQLQGDLLEDVIKPPNLPLPPLPQNNVESRFTNSFLDELKEKQQLRENRQNKGEPPVTESKCISPNPQQFSEEDLWLVTNKSPIPVKTFYFGMDEPVDDPFGFETFTPKVNPASYSSSESQISSSDGFTDIIYDETSGGISVQLRATLPRKQVDIPRFSPAAAWRMLSSIESVLPTQQEEDLIQLESRIAAPPLPIQIPAVMDKSADSGISGDASPQQYDSAAWTPQQDLEDTSSEGGFPINFLTYEKYSDVKYTPRFTLSLPKDDKTAMFTEMFDVKKSMYPFGKNVSSSLNLPDSSLLDNNWMLSCSIPNSINFINNATQLNSQEDSTKNSQEEDSSSSSLIKKPSFSYLTSGGHIMYLPEYSKTGELESSKHLSKSCENVNKELDMGSLSLPTNQDAQQMMAKYKSKKFTFQSTIRQNERKVLAEKLSRIAEYTELKRRSEMEVMQKVEEEFQKKREREKADIRQQLRLFNISNKAFASLESSASNP